MRFGLTGQEGVARAVSAQFRHKQRVVLMVWLLICLCQLSCPVALAAIDEKQSTDRETNLEEPLLRVALTGRYPPFSFYDRQGELDGFDVAVSRAIADRLDRPLEIITTEWDGILAGLLAGRYDAIIGSMAITAQREEVALFSDPYYHSGAQLFIHRDRAGEISGVDDTTGLHIGVVVGETYEQHLREYYPEVTVVPYDDTQLIFQDLALGRLDGFLSDRLVGAWQIRSAGAPFLPVGELLYEERIGIPVTRDNAELLEDINRALAELRESGELDSLFDSWFGLEVADEDSPDHGARMEFGFAMAFLLKGFLLTLAVAAASLLLGFLVAIPVGIVLNLPGGIIRFILRAVVDFIRGTPILIQLIFVYFGWPLIPVIGVSLSPIAASILTLSVNSAAYMSEVVRSGLMAVDPGQRLAARALCLSPFQVFRLIVWPQAFRIALPSLMNSIVALIKDTALISVITVSELIANVRSVVSVTWNPAYYLVAAVLFFIVTFPLMKLAGRLEAHIRAKGFEHD